MKHVSSEKYNLAWFKLAECVNRGEKERALGVYRLLAHSIGNDALATQLYADIMLSFNEKDEAIENYLQAIELYKADGRFIEVAAIYENILFLEHVFQDRHLIDACKVYLDLGSFEKGVEFAKKAIKTDAEMGKFLEKLKVEHEDLYIYFIDYF